MKKFLALFFITFFITQNASSQSIGFSGYGIGSYVKNPDQEVDLWSGDKRILGHMSAFSPGVRVEFNYILPGFTFPVSGFNGLGFSYFTPHKDSAYFIGHFKNGGGVNVLGTQSTTTFQIGFRFGYEIPQTFNDFLMIHVGWGMGFNHSKTHYLLPEKSTDFPYTEADFDATTFDPHIDADFGGELLAGAVYEFEKFSVIGQYSFYTSINDFSSHKFRHQLVVGIYYPLKEF